MGRNVVVGMDVGGWVEINYGVIGSRCTKLWLYHLFAVPKFLARMRKMTEKPEVGKANGASNRVSCGGSLDCSMGFHSHTFVILLNAISESAELREIALRLSFFLF